MTYGELKRYLKKNGCLFLEEGKGHELWKGVNGHVFTVGRHNSKEIGTGVCNAILKQAGLK